MTNSPSHGIIFRIITIVMLINNYPCAFAGVQSHDRPSQRDSIAGSNKTENIDSTKSAKELDELVVTGKSAYIINDGIAYRPDRKSRQFSWSAQSLLLNMAIPTVYVDRSNGNVTTSAGEAIAMFVDFIPASPQECANLNPDDVKCVEVLSSPADPRFMGAKNVVNFVMFHYEYGGYARADISQNFEYDKGSYMLYDKTTYKAITYDIAGGYTYSRNLSGIMEATDFYDFSGTHITASYGGEPEINTSRSYFASAKAMYRTNSCLIANTLSLSGSPSPYNTTSDHISYSPKIFPDQTTSTSIRRKSTSLVWDGMYQLMLNKDWLLYLTPGVNYQSGDISRAFASDISDYTYDITEERWSALLAANLIRRISIGNIIIKGIASYDDDRMDYTGSIFNSTRQKSVCATIAAGNNLRINRISLSYGVCANYFDISNDSFRNRQFLPSASLNVSYQLSQNHMFILQSQYDDWSFDLAQTNPALIRLGVLDAVCGNPELKHTPVFNLNLSHNWLSGKAANTSAFIKAHYRHKPITAIYTPTITSDNEPLMIRSYDNLGHHYFIGAGISADLRLLNGALVANGRLEAEYYNSYGLESISAWSLPAQIGISYYLGSFKFDGGYQFPATVVYPGSTEKTRPYYSIRATYNWRNLRISASVYNFCNNSWRGYTTEIINPVMSQIKTTWSSQPHRGVSLSVSYIFRYGKRVDIQNELDNVSSQKSSVLID